MTLQGRNLQEALTGPDVADLQSALLQLSYPISGSEQQASSFGTSTLASVKQFQTDSGLAPTGVVDATTAATLSAITLASQYIVSGTVSSSASAGVSGLSVQLVDKNVGGDVKLATAQTSLTGTYRITVIISPVSLREHNKTKPDLQVQVLQSTTVLSKSIIVYNARSLSR